MDGAESGESRGGCLSFVVADESVDGRGFEGGCNVDRVESSEGGFRQRTGGQQERPIDSEQGDRLEQLAGPFDQKIEREPWVACDSPSDRARQFSERELAGDDVRVGKKGAEHSAPRLLPDQLDERRRIRVEERHSAFAADLVQGAAQSVRVAGELERLRQSSAQGARDASFDDQPIEVRAG